MTTSSEETLFLRALEFETPEARLEFLETACHDQPELLAGVKSLLASYEKSEFLEAPPHAVHALRTVNQPAWPMTLGPYRVIEQIARGGMGAVFLAEQTSPVQRRVAVKIIRPELDNEDIVRRFHLEQRALALMDHKNIARVLDASTTESGVSYFVMEYVDGLPIHHYCRQKQLSVHERLLLFLDCARAIQHAHQKGILHRDIKPSNVLVSEQDHKPLVKVIDFGIAKALQQSDSPNVLLQSMGTRLGEVLGTPQFMSPEQASLGSVSADTRSDVYSLGALLYQLLTDVPPFETQIDKSLPFDEVLRIIRQDDPIRPSQIALKATALGKDSETLTTTRRLCMTLKGDLDAIVMKAMDKDLLRRYQNVGELIDDVERHQESRPILARAPSTWYMLGKFAHRRRGLLASMIVACLCLLMGTVAALIQADRARQAEREARADEQRAVAAEQRTEELLYTAHLKLASSLMEKNDPGAALAALERQIPAGGKADLRSFDWYTLARLNRPRARAVFRNEKSLYSMCLVVGTSRIAVAGADGVVRVINTDDDSVIWQKDPDAGELNCVACSPDGQFLSVAGDDGRVIHLHAGSGEIHSDIKPHDRQAFQIEWAQDGAYFVTCGNEKGAKVWAFPNVLIRNISTVRDLECLDVSASGDISLGAEGGTVYVIDGSGGFSEEPRIQEYVGNDRDHCSSVCFSPDGNLLASGRLNGIVNLYRKNQSGFIPFRSITASDAVNSLAFSSDQTALLVGLKNGSVETVQLNASSEAQYSLLVSHHVQAKSTASLISNQKNGYDWCSTNIDEGSIEHPFSKGERVPAEKLGSFLKVVGVTPGLVDGYFPESTSSFTIEFSEPVKIDRLSDWIQLTRRSDPVLGIRQKLMHADVISVDGNLVTLELSPQEVRQEKASRPQKLHDGDVTAIRPTLDADRFFCVGKDGLVVEFRLGPEQPFRIIDESVSECGFGYSGIIWAGKQPPCLMPWNKTIGLGKTVSLPYSDEWNTHRTKQARNANTFLAYNIRASNRELECRLLFDPLGSKNELLLAPGVINGHTEAYAISDFAQCVAAAFRCGGKDGDESGTIWMKNLESGEVGAVEIQARGLEVEFSPDAEMLLVHDQHAIELRRVPSGELIDQRDISDLTGCVFVPDGQQLLTVGSNGLLKVWAIDGLTELAAINAHDIAARDVEVSPDGRTIATVGFDGVLKLWRRSVLELSAEIRFNKPLDDVEFSPDGTAAIVRDDEGTLYFIDARPSDSGSVVLTQP